MGDEYPSGNVYGGADSLNNIKGVMLCNRPTKVQTGTHQRSSTGPPPFVAGLPKEDLGLNPSKKHPIYIDSKASSKREGTDYLSKHKQWLQDMKMLKDDIRSELDDAQRIEEEKKKKFTERSQALRLAIREAKTIRTEMADENGIKYINSENDDNGRTTADAAEALRDKVGDWGTELLHEMVKTDDDNHDALKELESRVTKKVAASGKKKPLWAMTEEEVEQQELDDADELLDFVGGLDYDKYIDDYEVRQAMEVLKTRIEELESGEEKKKYPDDKPEDEAKSKEERVAEMKAKVKEMQRALQEKEERARRAEQQLEEVKKVNRAKEADRILHSSHGLQKIHSKKSVANIMDTVSESGKEKENATTRARQEHSKAGKGIPDMPDPSDFQQHVPIRVKIVNELENRVKKDRMDPSNLPYLYRNPAI